MLGEKERERTKIFRKFQNLLPFVQKFFFQILFDILG